LANLLLVEIGWLVDANGQTFFDALAEMIGITVEELKALPGDTILVTDLETHRFRIAH